METRSEGNAGRAGSGFLKDATDARGIGLATLVLFGLSCTAYLVQSAIGPKLAVVPVALDLPAATWVVIVLATACVKLAASLWISGSRADLACLIEGALAIVLFLLLRHEILARLAMIGMDTMFPLLAVVSLSVWVTALAHRHRRLLPESWHRFLDRIRPTDGTRRWTLAAGALALVSITLASSQLQRYSSGPVASAISQVRMLLVVVAVIAVHVAPVARLLWLVPEGRARQASAALVLVLAIGGTLVGAVLLAASDMPMPLVGAYAGAVLGAAAGLLVVGMVQGYRIR